MRSNEKSLSSPTWIPSTIAHSFYTMVFDLHGLHQRSTTFQFICSILVVVDYFTKMVHFIACNKSITSERITKLALNHVFWYHGLFENIISNHRLQFTSKFWKRIFELLNAKVKLSLAFHPQTRKSSMLIKFWNNIYIAQPIVIKIINQTSCPW